MRGKREKGTRIWREMESRRISELRRVHETALDKEEAMRAIALREACDDARHEKERKEDLERERDLTRAADKQRLEFQAEKLHQNELHEAEAAVRHREMMESKLVEAERVRKADAMTAALMAVIVSNQEEAAKGRELATRQAAILEALMRERVASADMAEAEVAVAPSVRTRPKRAVGQGVDLN